MRVSLCLVPPCAAGDALIPCRLLLPCSGRPTLTLIEPLEGLADAALRDLESGFTPERALRPRLERAMAASGYASEPRAWTPIVVFAAVDAPAVHPDAAAVDALPALPWRLTHRRDALGAPAFAVVADGAVVSAAWLTDEGIAIETAPAYRRRGYARAAASALIAFCLRAGREVCWRARADNAASLAAARSLGLIEVAREWRPTYRKR